MLENQPLPERIEEIVRILRTTQARTRINEAVAGYGLFADPKRVAEQFVNQAISSVTWADNPQAGQLANLWNPEQVVYAITVLAAKGLSYDPEHGIAWLTPRKQAGNPVAVPVPGVRGMERTLQRTNRVGLMRHVAVREQDSYRSNLLSDQPPEFSRNLNPDSARSNRITAGAAAIAVRDVGFHKTEIPVSVAEVAIYEREFQARQSYLAPDLRASYRAYRLAMREVSYTYLHDLSQVRDVFEMEQQVTEAQSEQETATKVSAQVPSAAITVERVEPVMPKSLAADSAIPALDPVQRLMVSSKVAVQGDARPPAEPKSASIPALVRRRIVS